MASVEHCLYCFEVLTAKLETRTPMTLYQVEVSWADYPKGLDSDSDSESESSDPSSSSNNSTGLSSSRRPKLTPTLQRLAASPRSNGTSSTSPSTSTSSLAAPSSTTTASSSSSLPSEPDPLTTRPFTPVGIGRKTSQRSTSITESPLFVTWNKISPTSSSRSLRGCIGTFETQALATGLASYSLTSALGDVRFTPIVLAELPRLEVAVTLLTDFETCADPMDWEVGVHGLRVSFYHHHKRFGATYLPDVAVEQGWGKEECLVSLMRKAGWNGKRERWRDVADLKVVRYQGKAESVDWEEYRRWRDWVDGKGKEKNGKGKGKGKAK